MVAWLFDDWQILSAALNNAEINDHALSIVDTDITEYTTPL